jgi:disulfide bond formation protein DsbB
MPEQHGEQQDQIDPSPRYTAAKIYGGAAIALAIIGGIEEAIGIHERALVEPPFLSAGICAVGALAAFAASRRQQ